MSPRRNGSVRGCRGEAARVIERRVRGIDPEDEEAVDGAVDVALEEWGDRAGEFFNRALSDLDLEGPVRSNGRAHWGRQGAGVIVRPAGWRTQGDEGREWLQTLRVPGLVFRGMTSAEYRATVGAGRPVQSRGDFSFRCEGTCFAEDPADAEGYVNYGRDDPRRTGEPIYLIAARVAPGMWKDRDGYIKTPETTEPVAIWEMVAESGAVIARPVVFRARPNSRTYWGRQGAGIIILCPKTGRILLGLRSSEVMEPHTWGGFGGRIDEGEDPLEAALREVSEELGIDLDMLASAEHVWTYEQPDFRYTNFLATVDEEFIPDLNWENDDFGWFQISRLPEPLHYGFEALLPHLRRSVGRWT